MYLTSLIRAARLPFLTLTPVCILFAYALSRQQTPVISLLDTGIVFICALAAHMAVNFINEYQDFQSGLDFHTKRTPFSGGSGALVDHPASASRVGFAGLACLLLVCLTGLYLLSQVPLPTRYILLCLGIAGLFLIISYTQWLNRLPLACLIAPGLGFGLFMVLGSVLLLSKQITLISAALSLVPFFQINNLLLLNQYPDLEADRRVGRNHLLIAFGPSAAARVYILFMILPFIIILAAILGHWLPWLSVIALVPLIPGIVVCRALLQLGIAISDKSQYLALNVAVTLITPLLLSLSLLFATP